MTTNETPFWDARCRGFHSSIGNGNVDIGNHSRIGIYSPNDNGQRPRNCTFACSIRRLGVKGCFLRDNGQPNFSNLEKRRFEMFAKSRMDDSIHCEDDVILGDHVAKYVRKGASLISYRIICTNDVHYCCQHVYTVN